MAWIDINAGTSNSLTVLNNGDQTVTYQNDVGPVGDKRHAVAADQFYMNAGILDNYLGAPCNDPRTMKVCVDFYDDPALTGTVFGPDTYATDDTGAFAAWPVSQLYTTTGSGTWMKIGFVVPAVNLLGINTAPLTGGPGWGSLRRFPFPGLGWVFIGFGTNAMAGVDPAPDYFINPDICTDAYTNYVELDLQNGIVNGLDLGTSGGDQTFVVEAAGPALDQRMSVAPLNEYLNFQILNSALGPNYQDNARMAIVATYYDDPKFAGTNFTFGPKSGLPG